MPMLRCQDQLIEHKGQGTRAGATKKKIKKSDVPTYLPFFEIFLRFSGLISENILMVFLGSSCRETAKNAIKTIEGKRRQETSFFSLNYFRPKAFDMKFPQKVVYGVFELPLLRNAQKCHKRNLKKKKVPAYPI
jgi:hypothetical protein